MITAAAITATAREQLGVPFRHQGRLPGIALDCVGLLVVVFDQLGIKIQDVQGYARSPHNGLLETQAQAQPAFVNVAINQHREGDVLLFRFYKATQHAALVTDQGIIHCCSDPGRVVEHRLGDPWRKRITHAFRLKDLS